MNRTIGDELSIRVPFYLQTLRARRRRTPNPDKKKIAHQNPKIEALTPRAPYMACRGINLIRVKAPLPVYHGALGSPSHGLLRWSKNFSSTDSLKKGNDVNSVFSWPGTCRKGQRKNFIAPRFRSETGKGDRRVVNSGHLFPKNSSHGQWRYSHPSGKKTWLSW